MRGGKNKQPLGYTIIEVMIVLAISGVMFLIAANFISSKQARTSFTEGSNELTSQLQQVVTEVENGQYTDLLFDCAVNGAGPKVKIDTTKSTERGSTGCIFLGKYVVVNPPASTYQVQLLAGKIGATNYASTTPLTAANDSGGIDFTKNVSVPQALKISSVKTNTGASVAGFGFMQDPTGSNVGPGGLTMVTSPDNFATITTISTITICLTDGTRYATINFGGSGSSAIAATRQVVTVC